MPGRAPVPTFEKPQELAGLVPGSDRQLENLLKVILQSQEGFRDLLDSLDVVVFHLSLDGVVCVANRHMAKVLGVSFQELIGHSLAEFFAEPARSEAEKALPLFLERGAWRGTVPVRLKNSPETRHFECHLEAMREGEQITGVGGWARDITEAKQLEQQLAQKERLAAMGQMMAGVAHELNNPLTAILGISDLLRERADDEATRRQVDLILKQARRAAAIVQNLLTLSRPAAVNRPRILLGEILTRAIESQQQALRQKNIQVEWKAGENLPPIEGDSRLLEQVFANLLLNAEQAIASTRDHGTIAISLDSAGDKLRVTLSDDGPGIPPENLGKIFDPFFTTKRPGGGAGLGLTICRAVIKDHGGSIEVHSTPGAGATFRVSIPVAEESPALPETSPAQAVAAGKSGGAPAGPLAGHSILVADDEESIREIVDEGLSARGMKVESAANSEEAMALLETNTFEFALCDFHLPGIEWEKLLERVREQTGATAPRFVFMTGDLLEPAVQAAFREKGAVLIQKPFHISALATLLGEILALPASKQS